MTTVDFPHSVQFLDLCDFARQIGSMPTQGKISFKTGHVKHFTPTSMILLAKTCMHRRRTNKGEHQEFYGLNQHSYANNLGFSGALSLEGNPYPQGAFGGETYLPLSTLDRKKLEMTAIQDQIHIGDAIHSECKTIAKVVSQSKSDALQDILAISLREMFRNVFEHSGADTAAYCAQYWPSREVVEVCIADRGIGFATSLAEDKRFLDLTDRSALLYSLMPGVSSKAKMHKNRKSIHRSDWDNAGFGLFFAHRLFRKFGWFGISSGKHCIFLSGSKGFESKPTLIEGSLVSMRLNLRDVGAIEREINQIQRDAAEVKARLGVNGLKLSSVESFIAGN